eukprot:7352979-Prymnesium_polylepis.1
MFQVSALRTRALASRPPPLHLRPAHRCQTTTCCPRSDVHEPPPLTAAAALGHREVECGPAAEAPREALRRNAQAGRRRGLPERVRVGGRGRGGGRCRAQGRRVQPQD